jgi:hypothetical protein
MKQGKGLLYEKANGPLIILEIVLFLSLLRYGAISHTRWPDWVAMLVAGLALIHLGYDKAVRDTRTTKGIGSDH